MWAFAITVFLWSFYNVHTRGVHAANAIVGMGLFVGGLAQFMAGMWEFPRGNVYGSAFFTLFGAFWMSYAVILLPGAGIAQAYTGNDFNDAIGLYFMVWFIISMFFFLGVVRRNISFSLLTFFWALSYLFIAISRWSVRFSTRLSDAGGAFGFVTAVIALYIGLSQIHAAEYSLFRMPLGHVGALDARVGERAA
jgi:succinate-acetate transporter protein